VAIAGQGRIDATWADPAGGSCLTAGNLGSESGTCSAVLTFVEIVPVTSTSEPPAFTNKVKARDREGDRAGSLTTIKPTRCASRTRR
jgi:hypothetical protein